jgi:hypothetical protein
MSSVWNERSLGVKIDASITDLVSDEDVEYYCNYNYPFLQIVNSAAVFDEELTLHFTTLSTGWVAHDYGVAMSVSSPHDSLQPGTLDPRSLLSQVKTAEEMAQLIADKEWSSVEIVNGSQLMKMLLWIETKRYQINLAGYTPTADDEKRYSNLAANAQNMGIEWEHQLKRPTKTTSGSAHEA